MAPSVQCKDQIVSSCTGANHGMHAMDATEYREVPHRRAQDAFGRLTSKPQQRLPNPTPHTPRRRGQSPNLQVQRQVQVRQQTRCLSPSLFPYPQWWMYLRPTAQAEIVAARSLASSLRYRPLMMTQRRPHPHRCFSSQTAVAVSTRPSIRTHYLTSQPRGSGTERVCPRARKCWNWCWPQECRSVSY
jgi:hypothetical protein